jgi:hypothetical protein
MPLQVVHIQNQRTPTHQVLWKRGRLCRKLIYFQRFSDNCSKRKAKNSAEETDACLEGR